MKFYIQLNEENLAQKGIRIRHVKAPLPPNEFKDIMSVLRRLGKVGAKVSILDNFVCLE